MAVEPAAAAAAEIDENAECVAVDWTMRPERESVVDDDESSD